MGRRGAIAYVGFGNSTQNFTDDIILDTVAPVVQSAEATARSGDTYRLRLSARDDNSGLATTQVAVHQASPGPPRPYAATSSDTGSDPPRWLDDHAAALAPRLGGLLTRP